MNFKHFFCLFVILGIFCSLGFAQEITIEKALELAKTNNPDLQKQRLTLQDAQRKSENRWNKFLPNLSANANVFLLATNSGKIYAEFEDTSTITLPLFISFENSSFTYTVPSALTRINCSGFAIAGDNPAA